MYDDLEDYIPCEDEIYGDYDHEEGNYDIDEDDYFNAPLGPWIGNRRWGENGYVRAGRREARPVHQPNANSGSSGSSSSRQSKGKETANMAATGRRARRALKREAADKAAAAAKQELHPDGLGKE